MTAGCGGNSSTVMPRPTPGPTFTPGPVNAVRISMDPFGNASSQHATEVEPQIVSHGLMLIATMQQGRFLNAGSSDVGFATSLDGGMTWSHGSLPGTTTWSPSAGPYDSVSDPSVAFDVKDAVWLISSLPIFFSNASTPAALISRSSDGVNWSLPVSVAPAQPSNDKDWITCDNTPASPFYGHCYVEWDDPSKAGLIHMSTSSDGGLTWSAPANTANNADGIGGQPVVQPNGTVIVPINDNTQSNMLSFRSTDGGATWSTAMPFTVITDHFVGGNMRTSPLPSAAIDGAGKVYLAWQDCRFRTGCTANDIVMSTTTDGLSWSVPVRVPIDGTASGIDHFIPGLGIDPATMGAGAHIGLTYYYYPDTTCPGGCKLEVGFVGSADGGATWTAPVTLAGPMSLTWLAQTSQGPMVGDYIATAFSNMQPVGVFAVANTKTAVFDEAMYAPKPGVISVRAAIRHSSVGEHPIPGIRSDHGPRPGPPIR